MSSENTVHYRHILLFSFRQKKKASQACRRICKVYGPRAIDVSTCRRWYRRFKDGNCDLEDAHRSGRPAVGNIQLILERVLQNPCASSHEIARELSISHGTVLNHLQKAGYIKKHDSWQKIADDKNEDNLSNEVNK